MIRPGHYILNAAGEPVAEPSLFAWAAWYETKWRIEPVAGLNLPAAEKEAHDA